MRFFQAMLVSAALITAAPAVAEPIGRWWNGWGMGIFEYGYTKGDGTHVYISCKPLDDINVDLGLGVTIEDHFSDDDYVIFSLNGQAIEFLSTEENGIEVTSRASRANLRFLFEELKRGDAVEIWFSPVSVTEGATHNQGVAASKRKARARAEISLAGSSRGLGEFCL